MIVFGGCLGINKFDVLQPTGGAVWEMLYANNPQYAATISQTTLNGSGHAARVMMEGFSFDLIRNDRAGGNGGVMDRVDHLYDVIMWLQNTLGQPTGTTPTTYRTVLAQAGDERRDADQEDPPTRSGPFRIPCALPGQRGNSPAAMDPGLPLPDSM